MGNKMLLHVEHSSVGITLEKKDGNSHTLLTVDTQTKYKKDKTLVDKFIFIELYMYRLLCQPKHRSDAFVLKNGGMVYLTIIP